MNLKKYNKHKHLFNSFSIKINKVIINIVLSSINEADVGKELSMTKKLSHINVKKLFLDIVYRVWNAAKAIDEYL